VVAVVTKLARGGRGCAPQVANLCFGAEAEQESSCGAAPVFFIDRASGTNLAPDMTSPFAPQRLSLRLSS